MPPTDRSPAGEEPSAASPRRGADTGADRGGRGKAMVAGGRLVAFGTVTRATPPPQPPRPSPTLLPDAPTALPLSVKAVAGSPAPVRRVTGRPPTASARPATARPASARPVPGRPVAGAPSSGNSPAGSGPAGN
ncbi:MAG: hypothetical protein ACQSGP_02070, partial [Frankia sp.]